MTFEATPSAATDTDGPTLAFALAMRDGPVGAGGVVFRACERFGRSFAGWIGAIVLIEGVCLLPLVGLAASDGTLHEGAVRLPLSHDYATLTRFVVAMPLLALGASASDEILQRALAYFVDSGIAAEGRAEVEAIARRAKMWGASKWFDLAVLVILLLLAALVPVPLASPQVEDSWVVHGGVIRPAGYWYNWVALLLFRDLLVQWLWRLCLWTWVVWRFSRGNLSLHAGHPDGCGGLSVMGDAQRAFAPLVVAMGAIIGAAAAHRIVHVGETTLQLAPILLGYVGLAIALALAPALVWSDRLWALKEEGVPAYGALGAHTMRAFEARWLHRGGAPTSDRGDDMLVATDPSAANDFRQVHECVAHLALLPVPARTTRTLVLAAALPLVVALAATSPLDETVKSVVELLV